MLSAKKLLAQVAYNDKDVISKFEKRMWVCVSDPFDEFKAIIEAVEGFAPNLGELNSLLRIDAFMVRKIFLLVLDDVRTDNYTKW